MTGSGRVISVVEALVRFIVGLDLWPSEGGGLSGVAEGALVGAIGGAIVRVTDAPYSLY